ncbi:Flp pilus assembly protein CpaB [Pseudaminobacter arsenicus]|uniref:Flp pilus assembly protein CpaB n=1 Tax=Borborobacter arsenicus TaxID=1851146 RepID=A0A432V2M6_9HYPH|nr:Flp pilus assembly protein CpaB [Pseudaminobacter arsenicus]RUM96358.1 Flp pilus assembly protein CpaB [Pseudaminobacter arsenicus]
MRVNSIIMVVLASVFGIAAVVLANIWLDGQKSALAKGSDVPQDTIVVASAALKFGDTLSSDNLREIAWPAGALPAGAFKTRKELLGDEGQRQVLTAISANEPILATKITGPGQRATLSAVLTEGMRAVSIRVNDVLGVAGFVLPGDRVDVLLTRNVRNAEGGEQSFVDVLLQSVKVLAVDQVADESKENPTVVKAVTLEVSTKDAQKLTLAAGAGQLSLALRQVASAEGESTERVTLADLTGDTPEGAQPVAAAQPVAQPTPEPEIREIVKEVVKYVQPEPPAHATVGVFRDMKRQEYDVPRLH